MRHFSIGYAMNPSLAGITQEDTLRLTHINLAFGLIKDGLLDLIILPDIERISQFRIWNPALRIVLSAGGWGAGGFSTMAMTECGRQAFAQSCLDAVEAFGLDGIDIDWEYPCSDMARIDADPRDKENFTLLLGQLRKALGSERIVSIAAGASENFITWTQMDQVAQIVDYVQLMTYDMSGFSPLARHHAALGSTCGDDSNANTRAVVELFHNAGVPYEKMIIGAAFYGRLFQVESPEKNGLLQPSPALGLTAINYGELTEQYRRENGFTEYWDEDAEAAYLWNGSTFLTYESPEAIRRKCVFVKEKGLLGLMYWEHGADPARELLGVIADQFRL